MGILKSLNIVNLYRVHVKSMYVKAENNRKPSSVPRLKMANLSDLVGFALIVTTR